MLLYHVTDEFQRELDLGNVVVTNISSKKYGYMVCCQIKDGRMLKLLFNDPNLSDESFDFTQAYLRQLQVRDCMRIYGQPFHIVARAEFEAVNGDRCMISTKQK